MYAAYEKNSHIFHRLGLVAAMAAIGWATAASAAVPLTSAFTYQGHVLDAGEPITGMVDLQCTLFDEDVAGTAIAGPIDVLEVAVVDGVFTAQLDFGDDAFDGNQRWLEIAVRSPAGAGGYTTLSPRQHLTASPLAWQSMRPWKMKGGHAVAHLPSQWPDPELGVGIGTDNPASRLHVRAPAFFPDETMRIDDYFGRSQLRIATPESAGRVELQAWDGNANSVGMLSFNVDGGNVGIGTDAPAEELHVVGAGGAPAVRIENLNSGTAGVQVADDDQEYEMRLTSGNKLSFFDNTAGTSRMTIDNAGNVGIGTSNPASALDVSGTLTATAFVGDGSGLTGVSNADGHSLDAADGSPTDAVYVHDSGDVGIGTSNPEGRLSIANGGNPVCITQGHLGTSAMELTTRDNGGAQATRVKINAGVDAPNIEMLAGARDAEQVFAEFDQCSDGGRMRLLDSAGEVRVQAEATSNGGQVSVQNASSEERVKMLVAGDDQGLLSVFGPNGNLNARITNLADYPNRGFFAIYDGAGNREAGIFVNEDGDGEVECDVLQIFGGSDIAEPFNVNVRGTGNGEQGTAGIRPGMVVAIDSLNPGELRLSSNAYDHAVAGIISGAGGVKPGMTLQQPGTIADGKHPVALTGRVWCYVDADANGAVQPGDMLTTSDTPGHAMKATDRDRSFGASIGKAMSSLKSGKGLVLVLVNLQ